jgi:F0F1-type ATP synthase assembly protein I
LSSPTSSPDPSDSRRRGAGDRGRALREAAPYIGLGTTLAVTVAVGLGAGYWLDGQLETRPWFTLAGGSLGVFAALVYILRLASDLSKRQSRKR